MAKRNSRQKLIIPFICVLLSTGLWLYVNIIQNPFVSIYINKVPIKLINEEYIKNSDLVLSPNQILSVNLKVEGLNQDIRSIDRGDFDIVLDLKEYALKKGDNKIPINIVDMPSKINIKNSDSLTVNLKVEDYIKKDFLVESEIEIKSGKEHFVSAQVFEPSTIQVKGPKTLIDKIDKVVARGELRILNKDVVQNFEIYPIDTLGHIVDGLDFSQKYVLNNISVSGIKTVPVNINTLGEFNSGLKLLDIVCDTEYVEIFGSDKVLDSIDEIQLEAINLSNVHGNVVLEKKLIIPENITINSNTTALVSIYFEEIFNREVDIPIEVVGLQERFDIRLNSNSAKVKIFGYEDEINKIENEKIKLYIDVSDKVEGVYKSKPNINFELLSNNIKVQVLDGIDYEISLKTLENNDEQNSGDIEEAPKEDLELEENKPQEENKPSENKPSENKPSENKPSENKPQEENKPNIDNENNLEEENPKEDEENSQNSDENNDNKEDENNLEEGNTGNLEQGNSGELEENNSENEDVQDVISPQEQQGDNNIEQEV